MLNVSKFIQPPKGYVSPEQREYRKSEKRYYAKLRRLCQKHDLTYTRCSTYWDFSEPIGTIGCEAEGIDNSYEGIYYFLKNTFLIDTLLVEKEQS